MTTTTHSELIIPRGHAQGELALTERPRAVVVLAQLHTRGLRDEVAVLTRRLVEAVDRLRSEPSTAELPVGVLGLGFGAAPALRAAVERPDRVGAVVACDGRPDLAADPLSGLLVPVLLIGGEGTPGAAMNERAARRLPATALTRVRDVSRVYLEREGLEDVLALATDWFGRCLGSEREESGVDVDAVR